MEKHEILVSELLPKIYYHINVVIRSAVKENLENFFNLKFAKESEFENAYLSSKQAASFLKIKLASLYSKVEGGEISFTRSGKRKLLFSKKYLENYVTKRKVMSLDEINEKTINLKNTKEMKKQNIKNEVNEALLSNNLKGGKRHGKK